MHLLFRETLDWFCFLPLGTWCLICDWAAVVFPAGRRSRAAAAATAFRSLGPSTPGTPTADFPTAFLPLTLRQPRGRRGPAVCSPYYGDSASGGRYFLSFENGAAEAWKGQVPGVPPPRPLPGEFCGSGKELQVRTCSSSAAASPSVTGARTSPCAHVYHLTRMTKPGPRMECEFFIRVAGALCAAQFCRRWDPRGRRGGPGSSQPSSQAGGSGGRSPDRGGEPGCVLPPPCALRFPGVVLGRVRRALWFESTTPGPYGGCQQPARAIAPHGAHFS